MYVSSLAAAGPTVPGRPIDETRPPAPVTPYGQSKLAGEVLVRAVAFPWTVVRPPLVYGEWDRATLAIFRLANRGIVPLFGDGSQQLSLIYGADVAAALLGVIALAGRFGIRSRLASISQAMLALNVAAFWAVPAYYLGHVSVTWTRVEVDRR